MIRFGQALRSNHRLRHIFVVMSNQSETGGQILLVNFTSYKEDLHKGAAIFGPADYTMLTKKSVIHFDGAQAGPAVALETAIRKGLFTELPDVPQTTMQRMVRVAKAALRELSPDKQALLP